MNEQQAREHLGIDADAILTKRLITRQYRIMAFKYHPDRNAYKETRDAWEKVQIAKELLLSLATLEDSPVTNSNRFFTPDKMDKSDNPRQPSASMDLD